MKACLAFAAALLPLAAASQQVPEESEPKNCPPLSAEALEAQKGELRSNRKVHRRVAAHVGVDPLGRVLLALDYDQDEIVEEVVLFTPRERLEGPWSELVGAGELENTSGTLRFEARDRSVAIALAVHPADLPQFRRKAAAFRRVVQEDRGLELVRQQLDPALGRHLSSFDHALIDSWPESFRDDLVVPGTAPTSCINCDSAVCNQGGGCYTQSCNANCPGLIVSDQCQIGCTPNNAFACCNCTNGLVFPIAKCRCTPCRRLIGPPP